MSTDERSTQDTQASRAARAALMQDEGDSGPMDVGFKASDSPRIIPMGATQDMNHVRFEGGAIRKDWGWATLGQVADTKILALGEHGTFLLNADPELPGSYQYQTYRIMEPASGQIYIEVYDSDNDEWVFRVALTRRGLTSDWDISNTDVGDPPDGDVYFRADEITLLIANIDKFGNDQTAKLASIAAGAIIYFNGLTWTVVLNTPGLTWVELQLDPADQQPSEYSNATEISIDLVSGGVLIEDDFTLERTNFLSCVSIQNTLAIANGYDPIMLWSAQPVFAFEDLLFPNPEIPPALPVATMFEVGDFELVTIVNASQFAIQYVLNYNVETSNPSVNITKIAVVVAVLINDVEILTDQQNLDPTELREGVSIVFEEALNAGDEVKFLYKSTTPVTEGELNENVTSEIRENDGDTRYLSDDIPAPFTFAGDSITIFYEARRDDENGTSADWFAQLYVQDGVGSLSLIAGPVLEVFNQNNPGPREITVSTAGMGLDLTVDPINIQIRLESTDPNNGDFLFLVAPFGGENFFRYVDGSYDVAITAINLTYAYEAGDNDTLHKIMPENFPKIEAPDPNATSGAPISAPVAKYVGSFGDRLFGLWEAGDKQVLNASADGNVYMWQNSQLGFPNQFSSDDSVNLVLLDNRMDPIDDLQWLLPVSSQVAILGRQRSLMRVFETGNIALSVGATHWQDGIGAEAPYAACMIEGGVMFLAHNRMVYYMTADRLVPVGFDIQEELKKHFIPLQRPDWEISDCMWDSAMQEWYLGVSWDASEHIERWFTFDFGHFIRTQETKWRRRAVRTVRMAQLNQLVRDNLLQPDGVAAQGAASVLEGPPRPISPPNSASAIKERSNIFADSNFNVQYLNEVSEQLNESIEIIDEVEVRVGDPFTGTWESPTLNRGAMGEEATLRTIGFQYATEGDTDFQLEISGDGGQNYQRVFTPDGVGIDFPLLDTVKQVRRFRVATNTTGYDLRFRVSFPNVNVVKFFSYYPSISQRGRTVL